MTKPLMALWNSVSISSDPSFSEGTNLQTTSLCVLVVDKHTTDTIVLSHYLRQLGCRHHIAVSCEAASARIEGLPSYDAILVDLQTLGIDKAGLLPLIRGHEQKHQKQRTQIIAMSAFDSRNEDGFGFDGYLTKPCNPRLLAQKLGIRDVDSLER